MVAHQVLFFLGGVVGQVHKPFKLATLPYTQVLRKLNLINEQPAMAHGVVNGFCFLSKATEHVHVKAKSTSVCTSVCAEASTPRQDQRLLFAKVFVQTRALHPHDDALECPFICEFHSTCTFTLGRLKASSHLLLLHAWQALELFIQG
uniref:Putative secreted protein n=1 Tax=Ixodes ricinus TaxID=34613 RepID=A0A6B0UVM1_IXORI